MLNVSTVFSHCFFIANKDMMKGDEKKTNHHDFSFPSLPNSLMKQ